MAWTNLAAEDRPELRVADAGMSALSGSSRSEQGKYFPQLFVAGFLNLAGATNRDSPDSPFIGDPLNFFAFGAALGFEQQLNFHNVYADVEKARRELAQVGERRGLLKRAIPLDVERRHVQLQEASQRWKLARKAVRSARSWMMSGQRSFQLGVTDPSDLLEGFEKWAEAKATALEAAHDYFVAHARLRVAAGSSPPRT